MRRGRHLGGHLEVPMGTKNKGGKNVKKAATKDLKQKRAEKKAKRRENTQTGLI
jgi:hypothetical protein